MKKIIIILILFLACYSVSNAQIKLMDYISPRAGATNPTHIDSLGKGGFMVVTTIGSRDSIPAERRKFGMLVFVQSVDSLYKLNTRTLNNSAWLSLGLSSASDVSDSLANKLNFRDTTAMLNKRFARDTVSLSNRIDLKVNIADTANMLSSRFARDTASLSNRITQLGSSAGGALSDSINTIRAKILLDSTVITTKVRADSSAITTSLLSKESSLSNRINLKVNISDTSAMLTNRIARDTISLSNRINALAGATDGALADSTRVIRSKIKADSTILNYYIKDNADTLNARINLKVNIADTSSMLTNRIKNDTSFLVQKRDTAAWLNSRFARDTASLSERISSLQSATFDSTVVKIIPGYLKTRDTAYLLQKNDTAAMLSARIARDTVSLSNRINLLAGATGGALGDSMTVIRQKILLDSNSILSKIHADSTKIRSTLLDTAAALTSRINLKVNIADTSTMLSARIARDTVSLSNRINLLTSSSGSALSDSISSIRSKIFTDSTILNNLINDSSNYLNNRINLRVKISDTSSIVIQKFIRENVLRLLRT